MRRFVLALVVLVSCASGCGGSVGNGARDGGASSDADAADAAASCPSGGPQGSSTLLLGPPPGGTMDLWRGLTVSPGEGEAFTMPRAGIIERVAVQIFADPAVTACRTQIYRWCQGQRVLVSTTDTPASLFPVYVIDTDPNATMWDQDLSMTSIPIDPPVPVAAGEEVDAVFSAVGGVPYGTLVSVISYEDLTPDAHAIFPDGGFPDYMAQNMEYHAQIELH